MTKAYSFLMSCLMLFTLPLVAQEPSQPVQLELDLDSDNTTIELIALPDSSLLLYTKTTNAWYTQATYEFTKYDHELKKVWHIAQELELRSEYIHHYIEAPYAYIAFDKTDRQEYYFVKINLTTGESSLAEYEIPAIDAIEEFKVLNGQYFVIGNDKKEFRPTLFHIHPESKTISPLPSVYGDESFFSDLLTDSKQQRADAVLLESNGRVSHLQTKSFDPSGKLIGTYFTPPQRNKLLQEAEVSPGDTLNKFLIGVYGTDNMENAAGFFTMPLIQQDADAQFYSFLDLKNSLSHLNQRQEKRIRRREQNRLERRKDSRLTNRLLLHDLISTQNGYVLAAEVYTAQYNNNIAIRPYTGIPIRQRNETYRHKQVLVLGFNKNGELIWDNNYKLEEENITNFLHPTVEIAAAPDGRVIIALPDEEEVIYHIMDQNNFTDEETKLKLKGPNEGDKIVGTSEHGIISWYGSSFAAFGYHRIRSAAREGRDVFYINKITF